MKVSKGTIARTAILVLTMINSGLAIFGKSPLPISDETVTQVVSFGFSTAAALVAWWKNNSFTESRRNDERNARVRAERTKII